MRWIGWSDMATLKDRIAVITGATSGIGRATAIRFAGKGSNVVLAGRRVEKLEDVQRHIQESGGLSTFVQTDVSNPGDVVTLFDTTEITFGNVDILVNCAGRGLQRHLLDISLEEWQSVIDTNLTGVFLCTQEAVRRMTNRGTKGHIITVSSIAGLYGGPRYSAYSASKHGVTGFQRSVRWELRASRIKVSTVHPFRVSTEFFDVYDKRPPNFHMLSPDDVASHILAIASGSLAKRLASMGLNVGKRLWGLTKGVRSSAARL